MGHIRRTITLLSSIKKIQNLCSNSCSERVHSKAFKPCLEIPYRSKVIIETVTEGDFTTNFLSDRSSWITSLKRIFYQKFCFQIIDNVILEKYFPTKFVSESLDFHFHARPSAHNWISYFGYHGGKDSKDNNSLDFHQKRTKFVFKFKLWMCTF